MLYLSININISNIKSNILLKYLNKIILEFNYNS